MNLAFGARLSLLELIAELEEVLGRRLEVEHGPSRAGDVRHSDADDGVLRALFPDVTPVPRAQALRATVQWYEAHAEQLA